jgi:hypothetical protein
MTDGRGEAFRKMNVTHLLRFVMCDVYVTTVSSLIKWSDSCVFNPSGHSAAREAAELAKPV